MQLRRILLLFALVLGLSALAASLAPPPSPRKESGDPAWITAAPERPAARPRVVRLSAAGGREPRSVRVAAGARLSVQVSVRRTGDVEIEDLGLRQTATPLAPARFELIAPASGRTAVVLHPLRGRPRVVGRLRFAPLRPRRRPG